MKKVRRLILTIICMFLAICQINSNVYSYTKDEVKDIINFKTVEENGEPDSYDVLIEGSELINNVRFSPIKASIEIALYGKNDLLDINFLNNNSTNKNTAWTKISDIVKVIYRVTLYLAVTAMLTLLIYMAISMILSIFGGKDEGTNEKKISKNPFKNLRSKRFFEEWIKSLLILALSAYIINLIVGFSNFMSSVGDVYDLESNNDSFVVYVKDSPTSYYFDANIERLLMFESQYKWSDIGSGNTLKNLGNIFCGFLITVSGYILYGMFFLRMIILAVLTAIAPVIIIINAYQKVSGYKIGILSLWIRAFLYLVFFRAILGIVFYTIGGTSKEKIVENPYFMLIAIAVMFALIIISWIFIFKGYKKRINDSKNSENS